MTEEEEAARAADAEDPAARTLRWLLTTTSGALSTISCEPGIEGAPFGSVAPFAIDDDGAPFVLIADIAAHTRNLVRDPRASLLVAQTNRDDGDPQAGWRVTLVGAMRRLAAEGPAWDALHARYCARVPAANEYLATHGFGYWRLDVAKVRFIGGFGKIRWLDAAAVHIDRDGGGIGEARAGAIAHMNDDHVPAMLELAKSRGVAASAARMVALERTGFLIDADGKLLWFGFDAPVDAAGLRGAIVGRVVEARRRSALRDEGARGDRPAG